DPNELLVRDGNTFVFAREPDKIFNKMDFDVFEMKAGLPILINLSGITDSNISAFSEDDKTISNILSKNRVNVKYEKIKTKSLFVPLKSEGFTFPQKNNDLINVNQDGIFSSREALEKNFSYSFDTYSFKLHSESFKKIIRQSEFGLYTKELDKVSNEIYNLVFKFYLQNVVGDYYREHGVKIWNSSDEGYLRDIIRFSPNGEVLTARVYDFLSSYFSQQTALPQYSHQNFNLHMIKGSNGLFSTNYEDLLNRFDDLVKLTYYLNDVYNKYLMIPPIVPQRVRDLALSITSEESNNYDKVKAIEKYLSSNYTYTLTPGATPSGRDFVDYFLFDQKEGYCAYYASSMVILTRSIGIPARYVEGYVLPPRPVKGDLYEVTNQQAHAWVEVYFEGIGWVPFEPTSTFESSLYFAGSYGPNMAGMDPQTETIRQYLEDFNDRQNAGAPYENLQNSQDNSIAHLTTLAAVLILVVIIPFGILILSIIRRKRRLNKIGKMNPKESVIRLYEIFLKYLLHQGTPVKAGETPLEYAKRLDDYGYFYPYKFDEISAIFIKARYSKAEVTEDEKNIVFKFYNKILLSSRKNLGLVKYFFLTYVLQKI
ncbi:MAG: DUF4129 domain-containing transglutaminase family protein, partial [Bacillota bacterium]